MSVRRVAPPDNRERLEGGAKAIAEGLIGANPELKRYEAAISAALYDFGTMVWSHGVTWEDEPDTLPENLPVAESIPFELSLFGPLEFGIVG